MNDPVERGKKHPSLWRITASAVRKEREGVNGALGVTAAMVFVLAAMLALAVASNRDADNIQAQNLPPSLGLLLFDGVVTIAGANEEVSGFRLTARVEDWVSQPVIIGEGTVEANGFEGLAVDPPQELIGSEIKFWLEDAVESTTINYYAGLRSDGSFCFTCPVDFLEKRVVNLDFPTIPARATPTPVPATPNITTFAGQAFTSQGLVPDGYEIFAVVGGNLRSQNATVMDGSYSLAIESADAGLNGAAVQFFVIDKGNATNPNKTLEADTPSVFQLGESTDFRLFFPVLTATPVPVSATPVPPTATPAPPTATPVPPTATTVPPTATWVPPTATPVPPTPTPLPPTATPVPPTPTPVPPTATPVPSTPTPVPPTATTVPPTATSVPPTATAVPPTATSVPPTATPVPPTETPVSPTATPVPPPTATPMPPTATPVPTPVLTPVPEQEEEEDGGFNPTIPLAILLTLVLAAFAAYIGWRFAQQSNRPRNN